MSKKIEKMSPKSHDNIKTNKKDISNKYKFFFVFMVVQSGVLVFSIILHAFFETSISVLIRNVSVWIRNHFTNCITEWIHSALEFLITRTYRLASTAAVFETAKAIGICSVFIGWMYAALDKEELGKKYWNLLDQRYKRYSLLVGIHFTVVLACLWLAKIEYIESAFIAELIMLCGCILQWRAIKNIILSAEKRRSTAINLWKSEIQEAEKQENKEKQYETLKGIAKVISDCGINRCYELEAIFTSHVVAYLSSFENEKIALQKEIEIWSSLFTKDDKSARIFISANMFSNLNILMDNNATEKKHKALCIISVAYILWLHNYYFTNSKSEARMNEREYVLQSIKNEFAIVKLQTNGIGKQTIFEYGNSAVVVLTWLYFVLELIGFSELLGLNQSVRTEMKPIYKEMANGALSEKGGDFGFSDEQQEHAFEVAFRRVTKEAPD